MKHLKKFEKLDIFDDENWDEEEFLPEKIINLDNGYLSIENELNKLNGNIGDNVNFIKRGVFFSSTIINVQHNVYSFQFDLHINGHNSSGKGKEGHCWSIGYGSQYERDDLVSLKRKL